MEIQSNRIARNTSYYTLALIIQKLISFVYFSYVAVQIGVNSLGNYTFALFFTTIFAIIIDLGLSNVLVREVSKDQAKSQDYFSSVMAIKIPLAIFTYCLIFIIINLLHESVLVKELVYLAGIIMVVDSFTLTFYSFLRGWHNLKFESIGTVIFELIIAATGIVLIHFTRDLRILILAILLGSLFNCFYSLYLLKSKLNLKFLLKSNKQITKSLLLIAVPFALAAIFTRVYGYIDTVLIKQMVSSTAVGYYSIPYKITFSMQFIPMAFVASLYPAFASYFVKDKEMLKKTFEKSMIYLGILAVPITFGLVALARPIMLKVYTNQYLNSVLPLQILILSLLFLFLNFPLGSLLNACNRQTRNTIHIGIVMIINIVLNVIFIPKYSYIGAAVISTVSTIIMFALQMYVARQIVDFSYKNILINYWKIFLSSILMFLAINYLKNSVNFVILIVLGALIYGLVMFLLKAITKEDFKLIFKSFSRS
jgi:O-antigen/teichoic acid export membrane protein